MSEITWLYGKKRRFYKLGFPGLFKQGSLGFQIRTEVSELVHEIRYPMWYMDNTCLLAGSCLG
jgi:hypothetical protein